MTIALSYSFMAIKQNQEREKKRQRKEMWPSWTKDTNYGVGKAKKKVSRGGVSREGIKDTNIRERNSLQL